jgi:pimeloyl-[acyl-carrier protein] methyl ester esterase
MGKLENLVFVSGWGVRSILARKAFSSLCAYFLDLPPLFPSNAMLESTCHLLESQFPEENIILLGWSLGGLISIKLCERNPRRYKALILIASTPCFSSQEDWLGISAAHQEIFETQLEKNYEDFRNYYLKLISYPFSFSSVGEDLQACLMPPDLFENYKSYKQILFKTDLRSHYSRIQLPILVIQGEKDLIVPQKMMSALQVLRPHSHLHILPKTGHIPFVTHPKQTKEIIAAFLNSLP